MDAASGNPAGHPEQVTAENNNSNTMDVEAPSFSGIPGLGSVSQQASIQSAATSQDGKHTLPANYDTLLTVVQVRQLQTRHQLKWRH